MKQLKLKFGRLYETELHWIFAVYVQYSQILIIQFQVQGLTFAFGFFVKKTFEKVKICCSAENGTPILLKFLAYAGSLKEFTVTSYNILKIIIDRFRPEN